MSTDRIEKIALVVVYIFATAVVLLDLLVWRP